MTAALIGAALLSGGCAVQPKPVSDIEKNELPQSLSTPSVDDAGSGERVSRRMTEPVVVNVSMVSELSSLGLVKVLSEQAVVDSLCDASYICDHFSSATNNELLAALTEGKVDIAVLPVESAAVLNSQSGGSFVALGVSALSDAYLVENGNTLQTAEDLRGKTIYVPGKASVLTDTIHIFLSALGLSAETDVILEYKNDASECVTALLSEPNGVALLGQPSAAAALLENETLRLAMDINKEYENMTGLSLVRSVLVAQKSFVDKNPEFVSFLLKEYQNAVNYVSYNVSDAALFAEQAGFASSAVSEKALPYCGLVCVTGEPMKQMLQAYYTALYQQKSAPVGVTLPEDAFYYGATGE